MSETPESPVATNPRPALDADAVFFALGHPGRRRLLESLAQRRSCTAAEVVPSGKLKRDATSKQLQELVKSGLVSMAPDTDDARRHEIRRRGLGDGPGLLCAEVGVTTRRAMSSPVVTVGLRA